MSKKNVLIICSDEHARSALGCYGHPIAQTPALDKLAGRGTRFTRAYTPSPTCVSARASLATGTHVHENRCWSSAEPYYGQHDSWMRRLRDQGHTAVSIGKLHFRSGDDDNGFSEEILPMHLANNGKGWPQALIRDPLPNFPGAVELARDVGPGESSYTEYDRNIAAEAVKWLKRYPSDVQDKPWSLFVSFISPHYPLIAPQKFFDLYDGLDMPPTIGDGHNQASSHPVLREMSKFWNYDTYFDDETRALGKRCYLGLCSFLDDNIRQVLEALEESGAARDTVVIYLSDHGEMLGNHGFWTKSVMYEDSVAIPMIMSGGDVPVGINHTPVSLTDIAATVEDITGLDRQMAGAPWQGRSLQGIIDTPEPERFILSEYHDGGSPTGIFMIRQGMWKYVYYAGGHPSQLFNLNNDPNELIDLGKHPDHAQTRAAMHSYLTSITDPEAINNQAFSDQAAMLESFGGAERVLAMEDFNHTPVGS